MDPPRTCSNINKYYCYGSQGEGRYGIIDQKISFLNAPLPSWEGMKGRELCFLLHPLPNPLPSREREDGEFSLFVGDGVSTKNFIKRYFKASCI
jgi:hypothetical protein